MLYSIIVTAQTLPWFYQLVTTFAIFFCHFPPLHPHSLYVMRKKHYTGYFLWFFCIHIQLGVNRHKVNAILYRYLRIT